jgi:hypothetical protein
MVKGFKATLFAGVISLSAFAPAYAAAPVISGLPDIQIGDMEDSGSTDSNLFVFSNAFSFSDYVTDADTPDNQLKWSFGEFTNSAMSAGNQDSQYAINGVTAVNKGTTAIALDEAAGNVLAKNPGANQINSSTDVANFRDIVFSPGTGSGPFPDPSPSDAAAAEAGKALRFYVADAEGNLGYQDILIETVDDEFDVSTGTDGYQEVLRDTDFTSGWQQSGIDSAEVDIAAAPGQLNIIVQPAVARTRILGWGNGSLLPYDSVGTTKFVRGKFYVTTSNAFAAPTNTVPNFRLRVFNEGPVAAAAHFEYAQTGYTAPAHEPFYGIANNPVMEAFANSLRPSGTAATPSIYKVDFDPVDVPAAAGTDIGAFIESYTAQDPANATLSLVEFAMATYDAKTDAEGTLVYEYNRADGLADATSAGGVKELGAGAFNHEANFEPGRRQDLYLPFVDPGPYASVTDTGATGLVADTDAVTQDVFGIAILNVFSTAEADRLRIEANKLYRARFYATAAVPTTSANLTEEIQGNMRFRFQTVSAAASYMLDLGTLAGFSTTPEGDALAAQVLPGLGSQNPEQDATLNTAGEAGGWYNVMIASPLDADAIREDQGDDFGLFGAAPGPGSPLPSGKDVSLGVDLIQIPDSLVLGPGVEIPFGRPNRGHIRISAIKVFTYPAIDDGGYDY